MNIFYLSHNQEECAKYHCDKHIVKMPIETAQLLSTTLAKYQINGFYKPTHEKHPCRVWLDESAENIFWLCRLGIALCKEYSFRYSKEHKTEKIIEKIEAAFISIAPLLPRKKFTDPPQAMPEEFKKSSSIEAYKEYYRKRKNHLHQWKRRAKPKWI